jgi:hypothetical protein
MFDLIFFTQPLRRWIIVLNKYMPGRLQDCILTRLYPGDAVIKLVRRKSEKDILGYKIQIIQNKTGIQMFI